MNEYVDGKLLVAPPKMGDWRFAKTVLYLWKHDVAGAAGVILNKTMTAPTFKRVCKEANVKRLDEVNPQMYYGGPIMDNLIGVLHTTDYIIASTHMKKGCDIGYTLDKKIVEDIASGIVKPKHFKVCMGMASWDAGQLDTELDGDPPRLPGSAWLVLDYDEKLVFTEETDGMWEKCLNLAIEQKTNSFTDKIFNKN